MVQNLKIILIAAVSALASAYVVDHANDSKIRTTQQNTENLATKIAELQQKNAQLTLLLNSKKFTQTITSDTTATTQLPPSFDTQPTEQPNGQVAVKKLQDEQVLRKSENFGKWLASTNKESADFDLNKEMQRRFDAEAVDPDWAAAEEQEYLSLFSQNPELSGLALRETQCRTQQCVITISITDINQANELVEKMTLVLRQQKKYPMIIAAPDEQQGITRLYIGKNETSFDFN